MADEKAPEKKDSTPENRAEALKAWHIAKTREEKAAAVKNFPVLRTIFSDLNHA